MSSVFVNKAAAENVTRGHPWIWRESVTRASSGVKTGDVVRVVGPESRDLGDGVYDADSPIVVRMWTRARRLDRSVIDDRIRGACALRARLFDDVATTAYRLINGEGDRLPGIVVDRYGDIAVIRTDGAGAKAFAGEVLPVLQEHLVALGIRTLVQKNSRHRAKDESLHVAFGQECPDRVQVREHGVPFWVDLKRGQKTGAFLDQRENRLRVRALARGKTVLNLFSYAGGFSIFAALGGGEHVTSVDIAAEGHRTARASLSLSGLDETHHTFVASDAYVFLEQAHQRGATWDVVISDPPSFAPSDKAVPKAVQAYRRLHRACVNVLAKGGVFCASSCSSHIDARTFVKTLDDASIDTDALRLVELYGNPSDHPTLPAWPEGHYLKFAVLA